MKVHFSTVHIPFPYFRQTPEGDGRWGDLTFMPVDMHKEAEWLVVLDDLSGRIVTHLPRERRILFVTEPPGMKQYPTDYLNLFGTVVSPMPMPGYRGRWIQRQPSLPWHYGIDMSDGADRMVSALAWNELLSAKPKSRQLSIICSNKVVLAHHRQRLIFVERLKARLGDQVDVFGRGFREIGDKAEAIAPYRYHIVLENNTIDHFWTEKLADAWLGDSFPIFSGCKNADIYFPSAAFAEIDISRPDEAVDRIEEILKDDPRERHLDLIRESRRRVMEEYNLFAEVEQIILDREQLGTKGHTQRASLLKPSTRYGLSNNAKRWMRFGRRLPSLIYSSLVPEHIRLHLKLVRANRAPCLYVDSGDRLGERMRKRGYYSQRGQDYFIDKLFNFRKSGFFVDVGANHPTEINNTWHFEQAGWNGLSFEPQDRLRALFAEQRLTPVLPYVLGAEDGEVDFNSVETDHWSHALAGVSGVAEMNVPALEGREIRTSKKPMRRLDGVLDEHGIRHVDFMSIDVEGFEMEVLLGLDLQRIKVDVLIVENDRTPFGDQSIRDFLAGQGYSYIARLSGDDVFRRRKER